MTRTIAAKRLPEAGAQRKGKRMPIVAVSGSRNWPKTAAGERIIRKGLDEQTGGSIILVGDCPTGADPMVKQYARSCGNQHATFHALWDNFGDAAGPRRNGAMLECAYRMVAFWDGRTEGTGDAIKQALKRTYFVAVYTLDGGEYLLDPSETPQQRKLIVSEIAQTCAPLSDKTRPYPIG